MYSTHIETISETCSSLPVETTTSNAKPPSYAEAIGQLFAESELLPSYEFLYSPKHGIISGLQSAFRAFLITSKFTPLMSKGLFFQAFKFFLIFFKAKEKFTSAVVCLFLIAIFVVCPAVQFIFGVYYQKECLDYDGKTVLASWLLTNSFFLVLLGFLLFIYCNYKCLQMLLFVAGFLFSWLLRGHYHYKYNRILAQILKLGFILI